MSYTPIILAGSRFKDNTPTATDTAAGSDVRFLADERTFTYWEGASAGIKYITVDCLTAKSADTVAIIGHNFATAGIALAVESSANNADWTSRLGSVYPGTDHAFLQQFTSASARYWRVKFTSGSAAPIVAQLSLGTALEFPKAPVVPVTPWSDEIESETTIGKTGNILGSVTRFSRLQMSFTWRLLERAWVDGEFRTFWDEHAAKLRPFFWAWEPDTFPTQVYYVTINPSMRLQAPITRSYYADSLKLDLVGVREA